MFRVLSMVDVNEVDFLSLQCFFLKLLVTANVGGCVSARAICHM